MAAHSHRLSILTRHEIDELYALPRFTDEDRHAWFELSEAEQQLVHSRTTSVAAHLTLQLGYFKAKYQFSTTIRKRSKTICITSWPDTFRART